MNGILFKPEMVQAIVEGRKTVTRRVIKPQPIGRQFITTTMNPNVFALLDGTEKRLKNLKAPYEVGETVYIKEAWRPSWKATEHYSAPAVEYKLGGEILARTQAGQYPDGQFHNAKWRSPLFMPEWAARYFIEIKDVRAERLQEITLEDAKAEGMPLALPYTRGNDFVGARNLGRLGCFQVLWDSINKDYPWESNPWVFRYEFGRNT